MASEETADHHHHHNHHLLTTDTSNESGTQDKKLNLPEEVQERLRRLRENIQGSDATFLGPFGWRRIIFADWLASARAYQPIENYIQEKVLPYYANTHTFTSFTGMQSNWFREEARQIIQESVNANPKLDSVIFTGSGVTGAVNKFVSILGLEKLSNQVVCEDGKEIISLRPVVFLGPYEHHSNILPWREANAECVMINEDLSGEIDIIDLENKLELFKDRVVKIGSFSAASNVTGVITSKSIMNKICHLIHKYDGIVSWDFAAAGPYVNIDMNPIAEENVENCYKDAIFISPHKFVGGVNTRGLLIMKKALMKNTVPSGDSIGGGTVFFVTKDDHRFLTNHAAKEEGGTPDIIGDIRAGLAFKLKANIGTANIAQVEQYYWSKIVRELGGEENIEILGYKRGQALNEASNPNKLAVLSFLIRYKPDPRRFLHYHLVSALLNDVFGIQSRSGCMCAGPYAHRLLGMSPDVVKEVEDELVHNYKESEMLRPGFTRLSLSYFISEAEAEFVIRAIKYIAHRGYELMPLYRFNTTTGEWKHWKNITRALERIWLKDSNLTQPTEYVTMELKNQPTAKKHDCGNCDFTYCVEKAEKEIKQLEEQKYTMDQNALFPEQLRWFALPSEILLDLKASANNSLSGSKPELVTKIIDPARYWDILSQMCEKPGKHSSHYATSISTDKQAQKFILRDKAAIQHDKRNSFHNPIIHSLLRRSEVVNFAEESETKTDLDGEHIFQGSTVLDIAQQSNSVCEGSKCFVLRNEFKEAENMAREYNNKELIFPSAPNIEIGLRKLLTIPRKILRGVGQAVGDFKMIQNGDRLLLGLSGGKDSLALLHVLIYLRKIAPVKFSFSCCTIDPMTESFNPSSLIPYLKQWNIEYFYVKAPIFESAKENMNNNSICSYCARMKRGILYNTCIKHGFNKLVLAQHLDDNVETMLMSMFHNGSLRAMKSKYKETTYNSVEVIRPFCYVREADLKSFTYGNNLPVIFDNCPACFEQPKERRRMKQLLAREESYNSNIFNNIRKAISPLMHEEVLSYLKDQRT